MKKPGEKPKKRAEYPKETRGSRMAAKLRKKANGLTEVEIKGHFQEAMALVYASGRRGQAAIARY